MESNAKSTIEAGKAILGIEFGSTRIKAVLIDEENKAMDEVRNAIGIIGDGINAIDSGLNAVRSESEQLVEIGKSNENALAALQEKAVDY